MSQTKHCSDQHAVGASPCGAGRYLKREYYKEWRDLTALLLGIPQLVLAEDFKHPKTAVNVSRQA